MQEIVKTALEIAFLIKKKVCPLKGVLMENPLQYMKNHRPKRKFSLIQSLLNARPNFKSIPPP